MLYCVSGVGERACALPSPGMMLKHGGFVNVTTPSLVCPDAMKKCQLSIATMPIAPQSLSALSRNTSKPGVASLLFHRTLSPSDALQVHTYAAKMAGSTSNTFKKEERSDSESDPVPDLMPSEVMELNTVRVTPW